MKKKRDVFFVRQISAADASDQQPSQVSIAIIKGGEWTVDVRATGRNIARVRQQAEEAMRAARQFVRAEKKAIKREEEAETQAQLKRSLAQRAKDELAAQGIAAEVKVRGGGKDGDTR